MKKKVCILLVAMIVFSGCGSSSSGGSSSTSSGKVFLVVGETITIGDWEITPISHTVTDRIDLDMGYFEAAEGKRYVVPTLRVKNLGKEQSYIDNDIKSKLVYQGEYEYKANAMIGLEGDFLAFTFEPLVEVEGKSAFELPDDLANSGELAFVMEHDGTEYWFELNN